MKSSRQRRHSPRQLSTRILAAHTAMRALHQWHIRDLKHSTPVRKASKLAYAPVSATEYEPGAKPQPSVAVEMGVPAIFAAPAPAAPVAADTRVHRGTCTTAIPPQLSGVFLHPHHVSSCARYNAPPGYP